MLLIFRFANSLKAKTDRNAPKSVIIMPVDELKIISIILIKIR